MFEKKKKEYSLFVYNVDALVEEEELADLVEIDEVATVLSMASLGATSP